jgi:hypothetical protein
VVRLSLSCALSVSILLASVSAHARPDEETTTVGILLGPRYVPHGHFEDEAAGSGTPVLSSTPWNGMGMVSFGYNPYVYLHVSLEVGYGFDSFTLQTGMLKTNTSTIGITSVPIVASVRITPWGGALYPYFGGGGGYMLNFFSGAPSGEEENHTYSGHFMAGVAYEITKQWTVYAEDRFAISTPDIVPIGELQTGGNMILLGVNFVFAPVPDLAPHDKIQLQ